jgi:hypothetical protein
VRTKSAYLFECLCGEKIDSHEQVATCPKCRRLVSIFTEAEGRGKYLDSLQAVLSALTETNARLKPRGVELILFSEGSGCVRFDEMSQDPTSDPDLFIFYSSDELLAWARARDTEREGIEARERAGREEREEREDRDFQKLSQMVEVRGGVN